jgi:hypothetical protein
MSFVLRRFTSRDDVQNDAAACRRARKRVCTLAHSSVHKLALRDIGQPVQLPVDSTQVGNKRALARKPVR